jgi:filamentous hemagglutinin family protein
MFFNTSLSVALAGPEGAQVVNGQVSFQQSGYNTTITASDRSIINYSSFDIARPETVQFIQPSTSASVLNRILSANPTSINGTLLANGRVFFVNPAGVYIGAGATINVNQLVASGLNISNSDFINGRYDFVGGDGSVINSGDITAERVYLIGKQVANSGNISCPAGYVVMASGDRVFLGEPGSDIVLEIDGPSLPESTDPVEGSGVLNEGTVEVAGGIIALAAAGDIYSQAISNVGSLSTSVETGEAGQIKLTAADGEVTNTGTIEASGSEGGQVAMEGSRVGQFGTIHADGTAADGGNVDLTASEVVALSSDSVTTANAGLNGNGGEVTVFSPDTALFWPDALIEVKGGTLSGNGGFAEVSGREHVEIFGLVNATAVNGESGSLLIDPYDVTISTNADALPPAWPGTPFTPTGSGSNINTGTLNTQLGLSSITITTVHGVGAEQGDITVSNQIDLNGGNGNTLTLQADDDIIINASILDTVLGTPDAVNIVLNASDGTPAPGDPQINVDIGASINTYGGSFTSSGTTFDNTGGIISTNGGAITVNHTGTVTLGADLDPGAGPDPSGTCDTITIASNAAQIQDAIDIAAPGAAVTVLGDTYDEQLLIDKSLTLDGSSQAAILQPTTTPAAGVYDIKITSSDVVVQDFTLDFSGSADDRPGTGIVVSDLGGPDATNVQILNNEIYTGDGSALGAVTGSGTAIQTGKNADVSDLLIQENTIYGDADGMGEGVYINPGPGTDIKINNNEIYGYLFSGVSIEASNVEVTNNKINSNLTDGIYGIRFIDLAGGQAFSNVGIGTAGNGNEIQNFQYGIRVGTSGNVGSTLTATITDNTISNNDLGIWARYGTDLQVGSISSNSFTNNAKQVQRDAGTLDIADTLASNTFDKAVTVDTGGGTLLGTIWSSIQDGIDAAVDGGDDVVEVSDGIYTEDLIVDKSKLTLRSVNGRDNTTIQLVDGVGIDIGSGGSGFTLGGSSTEGFEIKSSVGATTFNVQLKNAPSNVEISWNTIDTTDSASMGISVGAAGASGLSITNNTFTADGSDGSIWGPLVSDTTVSDNDFSSSSGTGYAIQFSGLTDSTISRNEITGYGSGVSVFHGEGVSGVFIEENVITGCTNGLRFGEYKASSGPDGDITSITVRNNTVTGGTNAIRLYDPFAGPGTHVLANNIHVNNNDLSSNTYGVKNDLTNGTVLDAESNWWGSSDGPKIVSNTYNVVSQGVGISEAVADTVDYVRWLDSGGDDGDPDNGFQPTGSLFAPVTNTTQSTHHSSISSAISGVVASGDILDAAGGTFTETVDVSKQFEGLYFQGTSEIDGTVDLMNANLKINTQNDGDLTLNTIIDTGVDSSLSVNTGNGTLNLDESVTAQSGITLNGGIISVGNDAGDKVTSGGIVSISGTGTVTINAEIDPTEVAITSEDDVTINNTVTADNKITATAGFVSGVGNVNLNAGGSLETTLAGSDVIISAGTTTGDVLLTGSVTAVDEVSITALGGSINDGADDSVVDITADVLTLTARDEIGGNAAAEAVDTAGAIETASLDASSTTGGASPNGDIVIVETDTITLTDVDTVDGSITITAGGAVVAADVAADGDGDEDDVTVTASTGDITIGIVSADAAGDVTITATAGSINDEADDSVVDITADVLTLTARDEIGGNAAAEAVDTAGAIETHKSERRYSDNGDGRYNFNGCRYGRWCHHYQYKWRDHSYRCSGFR